MGVWKIAVACTSSAGAVWFAVELHRRFGPSVMLSWSLESSGVTTESFSSFEPGVTQIPSLLMSAIVLTGFPWQFEAPVINMSPSQFIGP